MSRVVFVSATLTLAAAAFAAGLWLGSGRGRQANPRPDAEVSALRSEVDKLARRLGRLDATVGSVAGDVRTLASTVDALKAAPDEAARRKSRGGPVQSSGKDAEEAAPDSGVRADGDGSTDPAAGSDTAATAAGRRARNRERAAALGTALELDEHQSKLVAAALERHARSFDELYRRFALHDREQRATYQSQRSALLELWERELQGLLSAEQLEAFRGLRDWERAPDGSAGFIVVE